jgi:hypothetical protein
MSSSDPFNQVLSGFQGSAIPWGFTVQDSEGAPMDVSGWVVMYTVKKNYTDTDDNSVYLKDVTMPDGSIDGKLGGETPDNITQKMPVGAYPFDVRVITLTSPEPQMLYAGKQVILKTVGTRIVPNFTWSPP